MNIRCYTVIANWKMYFLPEQAVAFVEQQYAELSNLADKKNINIVVSPSFDALFMVKQTLQDIPLALAAQDCSKHNHGGAYTGQIAAASLKQLGCTYCIIGHSETRAANRLTNSDITQKMVQLLNNNITPIICIGETAQQHTQNKTEQIVQEQLAPIFTELQQQKFDGKIIVAYEPLWAIGTGKVAQPEQIEQAFMCIKKSVEQYSFAHKLLLLYGGSVTAQTAPTLKTIPLLDGFLVGSASTDFQELKKIVDCL